MFRIAKLSLLLASFLLSPVLAQEKKNDTPRPVTETVRAIEDPQMQTIAAGVDPRSYVLGPEDIIFVRVWREPELTGPVLIRPDGKISMPLVGEIHAAGSTPEKLSKDIAEALGKVMNRPEVFIAVQQVNSKKYYITGEVNRTGEFPLITETKVFEAISKAGGLREYANGKKIVIVRGDQRLKFNYKDVVEGKKLDQNILLQNGDHIIVP
jgi:polysaccharide export outer membrane protein